MSTSNGASSVNGADQHSAPQRSMLITIPRSCSNLLVKILGLEQQEHVKHSQYHFMGAMVYHANEHLIDNPPETWSDEQKIGIHKHFADAIAKLEEDVHLDHDNKIGFTKEHCNTFIEPTALARFVNGAPQDGASKASPLRWTVPGYESLYTELNETALPDAYLLSWKPIFLIRHPVRAFESCLKNFSQVFNETAEALTAGCTDASRDATIASNSTYKFHRSLYDFYVSHGVRPIIVDADDLVVHTKSIAEKVAQYAGLDTDKLRYEWPVLSAEEIQGKVTHMRIMQTALDTSTGVMIGKLGADAGSPEELLPMWKEKFGDKNAINLQQRVQRAMPDYEYLCKRRIAA